MSKLKKESAIDRFLKTGTKDDKKFVLAERDGLIIERLDKVLVTKDGKQLLRETY